MRILTGLSLGYRLSRTNRVVVSHRKYHAGQYPIFGHASKKIAQKLAIQMDEVALRRCSNPLAALIVDEYRRSGHHRCKLDPLGLNPGHDSSDPHDYMRRNGIETSHIKEPGPFNINELFDSLEKTYCGPIGIEFMHLNDAKEREWIAERFESGFELKDEDKKRFAKLLIEGEAFDHMLGAKFVSVKRYGGEGAEPMIPLIDHMMRVACVNHGMTDVIIGMPHRGRLNLLASLLNFPVALILRKMKGLQEFDPIKYPQIIGDVLSHLFTSTDLSFSPSHHLHVTLLPNPSHLEAISPVTVGKARAKLLSGKLGPYRYPETTDSASSGPEYPILPLQIHGDGSFSGQGVIQEVLQLSQCPHYTAGGSIHLIVNNQLGYTTPGHDYGRSSAYCSDLMKSIDAPIIHVNAEDSEAVLRAGQLAVDYRNTWHKDIAIDLICYRRWGHNELDDPKFTNPIMYEQIEGRSRTLAQVYAEQVGMTAEEQESFRQELKSRWNKELEKADPYDFSNDGRLFRGEWSSIKVAGRDGVTTWDTGYDLQTLRYIGLKSTQTPPDFKLHKTLQKVLQVDRIKKLESGQDLDWATAETLAIGSLLYSGHHVRISGQDVGRGTFSQRHAFVVDQKDESIYVPLNHMQPDQGHFLEVANSILSEEAVLGYEYGVSLNSPDYLVIWEAQFGDFFNGAQIMFDTFLSSGELKWGLQSGMVILLPHGMDGAGPEHSSCRLERFLQMTDSQLTAPDSDSVNWFIVNPTTPAQYFHLLRRQMIRNFRKPLIVAAPKMLLRHPQCVSSLNDMRPGTHFMPVLGDILHNERGTHDKVKQVILCSGKVYYTLIAEREKNPKLMETMAFIRIEELCPFPIHHIAKEISKYKNAKRLVWAQEEHENQGCWSYVQPRIKNMLSMDLEYVGRGVSGTPATGYGPMHRQQWETVLSKLFSDPKRAT